MIVNGKTEETGVPVQNILVQGMEDRKKGSLRPNLLVLAGMAWALAVLLMFCAFFLVYRLLTGDQAGGLDVGIVIGVGTLAITVISATAGSLLALAGQVAQPEPRDLPSQVPADTLLESMQSHERLMQGRDDRA